MNILIIGNGFDLAHGLKTKYDDFLTWAYENGKMGDYDGFDLSVYWRDLLEKQCHRKVYAPRKVNAFTPSFIPVLFRSFDSWIDLENNFAHLIEQRSDYLLNSSDFQILIEIFDKFLVATLEEYIANRVNSSATKQLYFIRGADKVLSFNYSNTFERLLYNTNADICYINGKAAENDTQPHIVFGCDYYAYQRDDLTKFNKIAQRANLCTDGRYRGWLANIGIARHKVFIVGHSLGKTDWDIIRPFITAEKTETTVFYHDEASKQELIHRMLGMVGEELMIHRYIAFKPLPELKIVRTDALGEVANLTTKSYWKG